MVVFMKLLGGAVVLAGAAGVIVIVESWLLRGLRLTVTTEPPASPAFDQDSLTMNDRHGIGGDAR